MRPMSEGPASNPTETETKAENAIIEFKITVPQARAVALAGTFNGWDPSRTLLRNEGGGLWRVVLPISPGRYEYRYVVDGRWLDDPKAKESVPNPFGGRNAVLVVPEAPRPASTTTAVADWAGGYKP